jgi:hypothetical protein
MLANSEKAVMVVVRGRFVDYSGLSTGPNVLKNSSGKIIESPLSWIL